MADPALPVDSKSGFENVHGPYIGNLRSPLFRSEMKWNFESYNPYCPYLDSANAKKLTTLFEKVVSFINKINVGSL
jgi:hypothetical protein